MSDLTLTQAAEKAYQAETILCLMQEKHVAHMDKGEVQALIVLLSGLVGDVGCFLVEAESFAEVAHA